MALVNPDIKGNPFYALMMAVANSSQGISDQQKADAESAVNYGKMEQSINAYWYGDDNNNGVTIQNLQYWIGQVQHDAGNNDTNKVTEDQLQFNKVSAVAQSSSSAADSLMQTSNSQASNDATNIQSTNQLASMLNIIQFIANLISKS